MSDSICDSICDRCQHKFANKFTLERHKTKKFPCKIAEKPEELKVLPDEPEEPEEPDRPKYNEEGLEYIYDDDESIKKLRILIAEKRKIDTANKIARKALRAKERPDQPPEPDYEPGPDDPKIETISDYLEGVTADTKKICGYEVTDNIIQFANTIEDFAFAKIYIHKKSDPKLFEELSGEVMTYKKFRLHMSRQLHVSITEVERKYKEAKKASTV